MVEIPKTCRACVVKKRGPDFELALDYNYPVPTPKDDEILIKLSHTGICMSDVHVVLGDLGVSGSAECPGHEGAGVVVALGARVTDWKIGDRAGLKPCMYACLRCEPCQAGFELNCKSAIGAAWKVNGSYCQYITHPASYATRINHTFEELPDHIAAPFQCSGTTTYRAVKETGLTMGQWLVIPGAGGGVGSLAAQYAKASGYRVVAIDTSEAKRDLCLNKLGCHSFIDFKECADIPAEVKKITNGGTHALLVTGGSPSAYDRWWEMVRVGGRLVVVGLPPKGTTIAGADPVFMVMNSLQVRGTRVGTLKETEESLNTVAAGIIKPEVQVFAFDKFVETLHLVRQGKLAGRAVIRFEDQ